jgi:hypothetical protein
MEKHPDTYMPNTQINSIRNHVAEAIGDNKNALEISDKLKRFTLVELIHVIMDLIQNPFPVKDSPVMEYTPCSTLELIPL